MHFSCLNERQSLKACVGASQFSAKPPHSAQNEDVEDGKAREAYEACLLNKIMELRQTRT